MNNPSKTACWSSFFIFFILNIFVMFLAGFIIAFNPILKESISGKYFIWSANNLALTQWGYAMPIIFIFRNAKDGSVPRGVIAATLLTTVIFLYLQYR